jgi:hypothetical protein
MSFVPGSFQRILRGLGKKLISYYKQHTVKRCLALEESTPYDILVNVLHFVHPSALV